MSAQLGPDPHSPNPPALLQFCQISKSFGEPVEKVLFVFDGAYTDGEIVNVQDLTSKVGRLPRVQSWLECSCIWSGCCNDYGVPC